MRSSKTQHKILAPVIKASHSGACKANHCSTLKDYNEQRKDIDREAFVGAEGLEGNAHTIDMPSIAEDWSSFTHHRSSRVESRISFAMINLRLSEQQANIKYRHLADDHLCSLAFIVLSLIIMIMLGNFSGKRAYGTLFDWRAHFLISRGRYRAKLCAQTSGQIMMI